MLKRNYDDAEYREFRYAVKNRDGRQCRWPDCCKRTKLQVHHILPWALYPLLRYTISNGITLCKAHHTQVKGKELDYAQMFMMIVRGI
jgi:5-methylcytosine-specific restriction endonuclease McrA